MSNMYALLHLARHLYNFRQSESAEVFVKRAQLYANITVWMQMVKFFMQPYNQMLRFSRKAIEVHKGKVGSDCALASRQNHKNINFMDNFSNQNHSSESAVVKSTRVDNGTKSTRRKREESPYLKIRSKAANIFRSQIDKSVATKKLAVDTAISRITSGDYTRERFLSEFKANVDLLLDSKRFERDCKFHNLTPFNAATHIVFDGTSKIELVLKNGVCATYSTQLRELIEPIYTLEELEAVSEVKATVPSEATSTAE